MTEKQEDVVTTGEGNPHALGGADALRILSARGVSTLSLWISLAVLVKVCVSSANRTGVGEGTEARMRGTPEATRAAKSTYERPARRAESSRASLKLSKSSVLVERAFSIALKTMPALMASKSATTVNKPQSSQSLSQRAVDKRAQLGENCVKRS